MTIQKLVRTGVGAVILVVLIGGLAAAWNIDKIRMGGPIQTASQQSSDLIADILPPPAYILEAYLETTLLRQHPEDFQARSARLATLRKDFDTRIAFWRDSNLEPGVNKLLTEQAYAPAAAFWTELDANFLPAVRANNPAVIASSYARLSDSYAQHRRQIDATVVAANDRAATLKSDGAAKVGLAVVVLGGLGVAVLFLVAGAGWMLLNRVVAPTSALATATMKLADGGTVNVPYRDRIDEIGDIARAVEHFRQAGVDRAAVDAAAAAEQAMVVEALVDALSTLASGDLTTEIRVDFPPSFARAKENFTTAAGNLRSMIQAVVENTESIRTGTDEIAQASEDLARRTESNAASLEETSAALVQIDGRLKTATAGSLTTVARADQAIATVMSGRATAEQAVEAMGRVSVSAKGIDSVIEGVDKIAFQTRVLAMNAAVEAGRAGDAGRGFAVVADLVSALAMRAEEEAKRARDQLTVTQTEIVTAVSAVQRVDGSLAAIAGDVEAVHGLLGVMASDNQAQSLAVTEISAAIANMDRTTQQNAAMVEETSAATRTLTAEVSALSTAANAFKFERRHQNIQPIVERRAKPQKQVRAAPVQHQPSAPKLVAGGGEWSAF